VSTSKARPFAEMSSSVNIKFTRHDWDTCANREAKSEFKSPQGPYYFQESIRTFSVGQVFSHKTRQVYRDHAFSLMPLTLDLALVPGSDARMRTYEHITLDPGPGTKFGRGKFATPAVLKRQTRPF
jgi:hypothetical protein